jgi:O-antigen ligase
VMIVGHGLERAIGVAFAPVTVTLAGVRALVWRPSILIAATVLLTCFPIGHQDVSAPIHLTPADFGTVALIAVVEIRVVTVEVPKRRHALSRRAWQLFTGILLALAVSTTSSLNIGISLSGFVRYMEVFVLVPVAVMLAMRDRRDFELVLGAVLVTSAVEGAVGTWQFLTHTGASYGGSNIRAVGTFGALEVLRMAAVVSVGILVALAFALTVRGWQRVSLLSIAVLLCVPLAFSLSRGSWIAAVCAATVMALLVSLRVALLAWILGSAFAIILVGGFGSQVISQRIDSISIATAAPDKSVDDRYSLWRTAIEVWAHHPITGVGLKQFPQYRDSYAPLYLSSGSDVDAPTLDFQREPLLSHMYLWVLSEQGLIGFLAFGALMMVLLIGAVSRSWLASMSWQRSTGMAASGVIVFVLIDFVYSDIGGPTTPLLAVLVGLVAWWALPAPQARPPGRRPAHAPNGRRPDGWITAVAGSGERYVPRGVRAERR